MTVLFYIRYSSIIIIATYFILSVSSSCVIRYLYSDPIHLPDIPPPLSPSLPLCCRYILLNTAISSTWGFPAPCPRGCPCDCFDCKDPACQCALPPGMCQNLPADYLVNSVRVYQAVG